MGHGLSRRTETGIEENDVFMFKIKKKCKYRKCVKFLETSADVLMVVSMVWIQRNFDSDIETQDWMFDRNFNVTTRQKSYLSTSKVA